MMRVFGFILWLCSIIAVFFGLVGLFQGLSSGDALVPLLICMAVAGNLSLPSPLGQVPPLMDAIMVYWWAFRVPLTLGFMVVTVYKVRDAIFPPSMYDVAFASLWVLLLCFMLVSIVRGACTATKVRRDFELPEPNPPRPRRPFLCNFHPYAYRLLDSAPGCTIHRLPLYETGTFIDIWKSNTALQNREGNIFFFVHGGGWKSGHARMNCWGPLLQALAARGWMVVSCEYRMDTWPHHIEDCIAALAYTLNPQNNLVADPKGWRLTISGGSAGGHLAALLTIWALMQGHSVQSSVLLYPALDPRDSADMTLRSPFNSPCCGLRHGQSLLGWFFESQVLRDHDQLRWSLTEENCPDPIEKLKSLRSSIGSSYPRTLIIHGTTDSLVPVGFSQRWLRLLQSLPGGADRGDKLVEVPGGRHAFETAPVLWPFTAIEAVLDGIVAWLDEIGRSTTVNAESAATEDCAAFLYQLVSSTQD